MVVESVEKIQRKDVWKES